MTAGMAGKWSSMMATSAIEFQPVELLKTVTQQGFFICLRFAMINIT